jgi:hypothetical protein
MKMKLFMYLMAFVATLSLVNCSKDELSDEELTSKIASYGVYIGTDNEGSTATLTVNQNTFVWLYEGKSDPITGTWKVTGGNIVITFDDDGGSLTGTISDDGKTLSFVDASYSIVFKKK